MHVPKFKVINPRGRYIAACHDAKDAAALAGFHGKGAKVRHGGTQAPVVWHEGHEAFSAEGREDEAAVIMRERIRNRVDERLKKLGIEI